MNVVDIISDSIRYPFSDITKFLIVAVIALLAGLSSLSEPLGINNFFLVMIFAIISIIFSLILSGYGLDVIRNGIVGSDEIPAVDFMKNLIDGIKVLIISLVYFLIPIIISLIVFMFFGVIGTGLNHIGAATIVAVVIAVIAFIAFAIFEIIAIARFAKTGEFGDAFALGEVIEDVRRIGIGNIILFLIIFFVIAIIVLIVSVFIALIPFIGIVIAQLLVGGFIELFYNRGIGLLYSQA
ncbi:DUF4013 domain-containing protein [Methanobrevibacter sp.]